MSGRAAALDSRTLTTAAASPDPPELAPLPLRGERALVLVADPSLPLDLGQAEEVLFVGARPRDCRGVADARVIAGRDLLRLRGSKHARAFGATTVVVSSLAHLGARSLGAALRYGARRVLVVDVPGSYLELLPRSALALAGLIGGRRRLARLPGAALAERALGWRLAAAVPDLAETQRAAEVVLEDAAARARPTAPSPAALSVVHYLGSLSPGGAERQLSYLAASSQAAGHRVEVWAGGSLAGSAGHYAPALREAGVAVSLVGRARRGLLRAPWPRGSVPAEVERALLAHATAPQLIPLVQRLLEHRPDVLHCWLDDNNVIGGLAGLAAGVPRVVLSTRNVSPLHFPRLMRPWLRATYQGLLASERVAVINNSHAGARDYAAWTGTEFERWRVVHNGFDAAACPPLSPVARARGRAALEVGEEDFLVAGVFRLDFEKRPRDFVEVLARASAQLPRLRAIHLGEGPLAEEVRDLARERGLGARLRFLGRREDAWTLLGLADASLLTSLGEGLPNVALESQALEVPLVLTDAGGSLEAVDPERSALVAEIGDVEGMASQIVRLAGDPAARRAMGQAGRAWVEERFGLERMVERTLACYRS